MSPVEPALEGGTVPLRLARLAAENAAACSEVQHYREQLDLLSDLSAESVLWEAPNRIEETLLRRYGRLLRAEAVFLDREGACALLNNADHRTTPTASAARLRELLSDRIEEVRQTKQAGTLCHSDLNPTGSPETAVLLSVLPRLDRETGVVIALRQTPFTDQELTTAAWILSFGSGLIGNAVTVRRMQRTVVQTVCALVNAIDAKDNYTSNHSERVGQFARLIGESLGLPNSRVQVLEWAGLLHDVGKIGIPEQIVNKPGVLTPSEFAAMKQHPSIGYEMLRPVAQFQPVLEAVRCHHENHDGSGYPQGLSGEEIPLDARIIHIVDVFDALTTNRPYRKAYTCEQALTLLELDAGRVTDPDITALFVEALRDRMASDPSGFRARFEHLSKKRSAGGPTEQPAQAGPARCAQSRG